MEVDRRIPSEFVYSSPGVSAGPADLEPHASPYLSSAAPAPPRLPTDRFAFPPSMEMSSLPVFPLSQSGPWAEKRVFVTGPPSENYQHYGRASPRGWTDMAKDWVSSFVGPQQETPSMVQRPQYEKQDPRMFPGQLDAFVVDAPPQPVYERVVYVPTQVDVPPAKQYVPVPPPQQVIAVPTTARPILVPLESEIVCRGHPSDRTELCFGCTIPPRQVKFDIIREETSGCFGLCRGQRFKAVCRKCRAVMPTCAQIEREIERAAPTAGILCAADAPASAFGGAV
ncbi:hypothetical protein, conserved [Eimeria tenella]|uniref:Uncharacterized protein n=1 Tax=Eimeria tenella TaxID=5802 RepID=U6KIB8_EIMTE|nr:hypothetical protein, conserved [Eimeria tenella]CDJ37684.1 hypothetical protein, conserved [Eimeria tenella]|eukprot:XP_013228522.1 hypothetical protein, conserved [Eimeria tenella]